MDPNQPNQPQPPVTPAPVASEVASAELPRPATVATSEPIKPEQPLPESLTTPEAIPAPETPATPEIDHLSTVAPDPSNVVQPTTPTDVPSDDKSVDDSAADAPADIIAEPETIHEDALDKKYFAETDQAIDQLAGKPFEEEEKAEDLQIGYLKERFGKELKKSEEE